jgi:hypothetical protein
MRIFPSRAGSARRDVHAPDASIGLEHADAIDVTSAATAELHVDHLVGHHAGPRHRLRERHNLPLFEELPAVPAGDTTALRKRVIPRAAKGKN